MDKYICLILILNYTANRQDEVTVSSKAFAKKHKDFIIYLKFGKDHGFQKKRHQVPTLASDTAVSRHP